MSTDNPLVSIIIPTYNRAHLIGETLDSVLAQTYQNWECIVVDDGSTDDTDAVMKMYCEKDLRITYHHRPDEHLPGGNGARNYGFKMSQGEYIQWFDSDDIMLESFLEFKVSKFTERLDIVITTGYEVEPDLTIKKQIALKLKSSLFSEYATWQLQVLTPSILIKREIVSRMALFHEGIKRGQETEFFSRLFFGLEPDKFSLFNEPLFLYRKHEDTKTLQNKNYIPAFRYSQSSISLANVKRGLQSNDKPVFYYHYIALLNHFYSALNNADPTNARYILKNLLPIVKKQSFPKYFEIAIVGNLLMRINKGRYYFISRWKKFNLI